LLPHSVRIHRLEEIIGRQELEEIAQIYKVIAGVALVGFCTMTSYHGCRLEFRSVVRPATATNAGKIEGVSTRIGGEPIWQGGRLVDGPGPELLYRVAP
jgi:hypothetical protein